MRAARWQSESRQFCNLHDFSYTTRANISHEIAEQIRARIVCTPAEKRWAGVHEVHALTGWKVRFLFFLLAVLGLYLVGELTHTRSVCVGVAETGKKIFKRMENPLK